MQIAIADMAKPPIELAFGSGGQARKGERQAWFPGMHFVATTVYDREKLVPGDVLQGPALLEEPESTTVLPPNHTLSLDRFGNMLIEKA